MKFKSKIDNSKLIFAIMTVAVNIILVILFFFWRPLIIILGGIVIFTGINALLIIPKLADTSYTLEDNALFIKSWILVRLRVPYKDIVSIKTAQKRMNAAALSKDRLELIYTKGEKKPGILISPVKKKDFVAELSKRVQAAKSAEKNAEEVRP